MRILKYFVLMVISFAYTSSIAAGYPERSVRVVIPFPPGGGTDGLARILMPKLSAAMGQQFIVDNRPGAGGNISTEIVVNAIPDGYTQPCPTWYEPERGPCFQRGMSLKR